MTAAVDVFSEWEAQVRAVRSGRWQPERDVAFWHEKAAGYDAGQPQLPNTLAWLRSRLHAADTLLDVGAGTGRLCLPLADAVRAVTALDHSPDMLAVLRGKNPPPNVAMRRLELSDALADPAFPVHDAVLSAWSLAYLPDLRGALTGLLRLGRRAVYLLEDDGVGSPHVNLRRELGGQPRPQRASSLRRALDALGLPHTYTRLSETRELHFSDEAALLAHARLPLPDGEALEVLRPYLTPAAPGLRYRWTFEVHALEVRCE